jgi:ubiquinone/menaquinone biosynthesis C-methylase UbiE
VPHGIERTPVSGPATYIHGTGANEQERLAALNRLTNAEFVAFLNVQPATRVLEVGSGLGLLAADVTAAARAVHVIGVELSSAQIAAAVRHPDIRYVRGDARCLPLPAGTFDLVYARYVLEHVADPQGVVGEMRRVTRPGGRVAACENDISLMRLDPACPAFEDVWLAFQQHQKNLGGDSLVGRRLHRLFRSAGFSTVQLSVQPEVHWHGSAGFAVWMANLVGNIESARQGLVGSGLCLAGQIDTAIGELRCVAEDANASSHFMWNRAVAVR